MIQQMKIIRMVQTTIGGPKKRMEDDPLFPEFQNFSKEVDEKKLAELMKYEGGKVFDMDLNKFLLKVTKKLKKYRDNSKSNDSQENSLGNNSMEDD